MKITTAVKVRTGYIECAFSGCATVVNKHHAFKSRGCFGCNSQEIIAKFRPFQPSLPLLPKFSIRLI